MSAQAASSPPPATLAPSLRTSRVGRGLLPDAGGLLFGIISVAGAAIAGYELVHGSERLAIAFSLIPLAAWLLTHPSIPLVLLGASIPAIVSISGSGEYSSSGYQVAASDLLLVMVSAGILLEWAVARPVPIIQALRPIGRPVLQYGAVMVLLLTFHHGVHDLVKTGQRFELFLLPLIVGAFAALTGWHIRVLKAYVLASTLLALVFPLDSFGMQHNPVGQFIANAILLLIGVRSLRRFLPCLAILGPGLVLTGSRGSILAAGVGIVVIIAVQRSGSRPALKRALPLVLLALGVFALAPSALQQRVTTLSAGTQTASQYAIYLRQQYSKDAHRIIDAHRWTGVGIGNYAAADAAISTVPVEDPHEVILLQEAEGGYVLAGSFILLIVGVLFVLRRMRNVDVGPAAAGVLIATVAHGLVDIYWVRGTPVLGWLVVGMACGGLARLRETETA